MQDNAPANREPRRTGKGTYMLVPIILLCIAVICLSCPPADPRTWAALVFAIVALLIAVTGWAPFHR